MVAPLREIFGQVEFADVHDWGFNPPIRDFTFESIASLKRDGRIVPDWIVTNPPFNVALAFFETALRIARVGVAFFVRSSWLSGRERYAKIYRDHPPTFVVHFAERVALIEGVWDPEASSATDYVWLVWAAACRRSADLAAAGHGEDLHAGVRHGPRHAGEAKRRNLERKKEAARQAAEKAVA